MPILSIIILLSLMLLGLWLTIVGSLGLLFGVSWFICLPLGILVIWALIKALRLS